MRSPRMALLLLLLAPPAWAGSSGATDLEALREEARAAMKPCGHCHDATQKSAMRAALRWFDLDEREWASALRESTLGCMEQRLGDLKVPEQDRALVRRYLDAEWARRASLPDAVKNTERAP